VEPTKLTRCTSVRHRKIPVADPCSSPAGLSWAPLEVHTVQAGGVDGSVIGSFSYSSLCREGEGRALYFGNSNSTAAYRTGTLAQCYTDGSGTLENQLVR